MRVLARTDAQALADLGQALGHVVRMQLLTALRGGPVRIYELRDQLAAAGTVLGRPDIAYHLRELSGAGLVERESARRLAPFRLSVAGELIVASFLGSAR